VHTLCETAGRGGNLLLNVSPMADGALPPLQTERLDAIAAWMAAYGESLVDAAPGLAAWQHYGPSTRRGDTLYLHLVQRPYESVTVRGLHVRRVRAVRELRNGLALAFRPRLAIADQLFNPDPIGDLVIEVPDALLDPLCTVLALDLEPPR